MLSIARCRACCGSHPAHSVSSSLLANGRSLRSARRWFSAQVEIGAGELRFSGEEARHLLAASAANLSDEQLERLLLQTDGWAIALVAVRQWFAQGWSAERVFNALAAPGPDLSRYLTEQILLSLTHDERDFLRATAPLERFNAELATLLHQHPSARDTIASLERKDLLVVHWDGGERWFRYHRLLSETVQAALAIEEPLRAVEVHRRAAQWFFDAGHHSDAVRHATLAGDSALLAQLFERAGGWRLIISGNIGLVRNALSRIPLDVLRSYPRSHLGWVLMLGKQGRVAEARREFGLVREARSHADDRLFRHEKTIIEGCLLRYEDAPATSEYCALLVALHDALPEDQIVVRATCANILTAIQFENGNLEGALLAGDQAVAEYRAMHSLFGEVFVYVHQGCALIERGRLRDAEATLRQAWRLALDTTGPNTETEAVAACMLACALHIRGERGEAAKLLGPSSPPLKRTKAGSSCLRRAMRLLWRSPARTTALQPRWPSSTARVGSLPSRNLPRLEQFVDMLELRERVIAGDTGSPRLLALEAQIRAQSCLQPPPRVAWRLELTLGRLALARRDYGRALTAFSLLAERCGAASHVQLQIEALLLAALAHAGQGQTARARESFDRAVGLAMFENYRQLFVECGSSILPLADAGYRGRAAAARARSLPARCDRRGSRHIAAAGRRTGPQRTGAGSATAAGRWHEQQGHRTCAAGLRQHGQIPSQEHLLETGRELTSRGRERPGHLPAEEPGRLPTRPVDRARRWAANEAVAAEHGAR